VYSLYEEFNDNSELAQACVKKPRPEPQDKKAWHLEGISYVLLDSMKKIT
jgi:hypothetical protein